MRLSEKLRKEFYTVPAGRKAPNYYRYQGYRECMGEHITIQRAKGIEALFTQTEPHVFVHDLIVGNDRGMYTEADELLVEEAEAFAAMIGHRNFQTNKDHFAPDYRHILTVGSKGLLRKIEEASERYASDEEKCRTLRAMGITVAAFEERIRRYRDCAVQLLTNPSYDRERLQFVIDNTEALLAGAPQTFAQALQLVWFCHTAFLLEGRRAMALGRMDQYLYPFFERDIREGRLTEEAAVCLLENVFAKIDDTDVVNICIGGMDSRERCQVNRLSYCIIEAVQNCNAPGPNLSARITPDVPEEFLIRCLKSIGTGLGYPALMNDAVNIAALRRYGYEEEDIYDYCMVGCIENFITGKQPPWTDGRFDAPRYLDYVFFNGISKYHRSTGLVLGEVEEITSMEEFMKRLEVQLEYGVKRYMSLFEARNNALNQAYYPEPFLSCFCSDCIGRGLDINGGGARYPSVHGVGFMGVGTMADSLAAIEKVVFTDREASLAQIRDALEANFQGFEELRRKLLAAPKYGNDDEFVDKYAVWFASYLSESFRRYRTRDGGGIYGAMAANVQNVSAGRAIAATPDGRKAGEPLSDAASPSYGRDKKGVTAALRSVSKPDYTGMACGTVVNQKFSPSVFEGESCSKLAALIRTYFAMGGQELQINATSRKVLKDAMEHPEQYGNLVVRVSGFSDYYTRLARGVQEDILNRTQQTV